MELCFILLSNSIRSDSDIYIVLCQVDIWDLKYMFLPLEWIGMNAMLVYVMAAEGIFAGFINGWYYDDPHNTLVCFLVMLYTHIAFKCKNNIRTNFYSLAPMSNQDE